MHYVSSFSFFAVGHTTPNLDDLGLAFRDLGISVRDLEEYVQYVESVPCAVDVPKFPVPSESHLNFLKPGSREVVHRPVYVHEHLPPMHPEMEGKYACRLFFSSIKLAHRLFALCRKSFSLFTRAAYRKLFSSAVQFY